MKIKKLAIAIFQICVAGHAVASNNYYPEGFEDFFVETNSIVKVVISGDTASETVDAMISIDEFSMVDNREKVARLRSFLVDRKISEKYADVIINDMVKGIATYTACSEDLDKCVPFGEKGKVEYIFDYDSKVLKVFASSEMFDLNNKEEQYHSSIRSHNALVNNTNLYVYASNTSDNFTWTNNTTLGMSRGFFNFDTQYNHSLNDFIVRHGIYDLDLEGQRIIVGYQDDNSNISINNTDFLSYGLNQGGYSVSLASSDNLLKGDTADRKVMTFYTPQSGQLEIYRDGNLLKTGVADQGLNEISYSDLPNGVYNVTIIVKQGDRELVSEVRQIVNNSDMSLTVGNYDYKLTAGLVDNSDQNYLDDAEDIAYAKADVAYRLSEKTMVASTIASDADSVLLQFGGKIYATEKLRLEYVGGYFTSGESYHQGQLSYGPFFINARYIDSSEEASNYANSLYGADDVLEYSLGYSTKFLDGVGYLNYFHSTVENDSLQTESDNFSLSWDRDLFGGTFGINSTYSIYDDGHDNYSVTLSWSYEFDDTYSTRSSFSVDDDGFAYYQQDVTSNMYFDDYSVTGNLSARASDVSWENDLSISGRGQNDYMHYNAYGYLSTDGNRSISSTMTSTQIVSSNDVLVTSERGKSFVHVKPQWITVPEDDSSITYSIYKDGTVRYEGMVGAEKSFVKSLPVHSEVCFELDTEYSDVEVDNKYMKRFTSPGTYYELDSEVTPLKSQIFLLNDIEGESVSTAACSGDGCKTIEPLSTDGVFRITYRDNESFNLVSDDRICVFNPKSFGERYVKSYCLEGILDSDDENKHAYENMKYIGVYESNKHTILILERLKELGIASKFVEVGNKLFVYVKVNETMSIAQTQTLSELEQHIVSNGLKLDSKISVTNL